MDALTIGTRKAVSLYQLKIKKARIMTNEYPYQNTSCLMTTLVSAIVFRDRVTDQLTAQLELDRLGL